tara:strand:- start:15 stop:662 length:648 start_codon:yes stop_codon:yes gene_type:complete
MPRSTINGTAIDLDGKEMILDADQDTTITADTDDQIDIKIAGSDSLRVKANEIENVSGDLTIDVAGDIILNADGGQVHFKDDSTEIGVLENSSSDFKIESRVQDKDIIFAGNDNGSGITALTLDMSEAGAATFNAGATFGGAVLPAADDTHDLGSSSKQWRDIYTGDINLNNTKTRDNEVDGTRGSWTIQEGKDDLYILNRLNGKKYRFKLEEMK